MRHHKRHPDTLITARHGRTPLGRIVRGVVCAARVGSVLITDRVRIIIKMQIKRFADYENLVVVVVVCIFTFNFIHCREQKIKDYLS